MLDLITKSLRIYSHMMHSQQFTTIKQHYITTIIMVLISKGFT